jgi:hypothetical protein
MADIPREPDGPASPLEAFLRAYLDAAGGVWDEIEPQVYDVLLPGADAAAEGGVVRVTFDPEALPEHPAAQLASFGTPFIDRLLHNAVQRGRAALFYLVGLNLTPHDLPGRIGRALTLPAPLELRLERVRALHFTQAVFWFQAEFVSDQREQEIIPVAIDLHLGREVRHLDRLLDRGRLAREPAQPLPDARRVSVAVAYRLARDQVLRSVAAHAHGRSRELSERLERQVARVRQYYADLRSELAEQARRARDKDEAAARLPQRRETIDREEQLRIAELRQKSQLRVHLRLLQLLLIQQPKLLLGGVVTAPGRPAIPLELVWDPLTETLEAPLCPACQRPTYALDVTRPGQLVCPACAGQAAVDHRKGPR